MAFSYIVGGMTFTDASFQGNAYADEATGFPKALEKMVEHVANAYHGTSTDPLTVGAGSKALAISNTNGQIPAFAIGMPVRIARTSNPSGVWMQGEITAWDGATGVATINVDATKGSGSFSDWSIAIGGHLTTASGTPPLAVSQGGTGASSGKAALANLTPGVSGIIETNANFVDAVIFGPALDPVDWSPRTAAPTSSLMLATVKGAGADAEVNIWDLTDDALAGAAPLATIVITGAATPTSIAAAMGYIIVGSENGITIIDPHDVVWEERTTGYPKSLSTTTVPALTSASILTVAAGLKDTNAPDPRTGGPLPSFYIQYAGGTNLHSFWNDDGYFATAAGTPTGLKGVAFDGQGRLLWSDATTRLMRSAPLTVLAAPSTGQFSVSRNNSFPYGFAPNNAVDARNGKAAIASTAGLTFALLGLSANDGVSSAITRAYNTGYLHGDIRGAWLANSKTADRSYKANTLTETGAVTEAAVEPGAELKGYSGFSAANYLSLPNDTDLDFGTGDMSIRCWFKSSGTSAVEYLVRRRNTAGTGPAWELRINVDGTIQGQINDGSNIRQPVSTGAYDDGLWHQAILSFYAITNIARLYIDGVLDGEALPGSFLGSLNMTSGPCGIGTNGQILGGNPATSSTLALVHISASAPSAAQARAIHEAEIGMLKANAKCLLQSATTDAVLDVSVDPITQHVAATQADHAAIWDGLAIDSELTLATGGGAWEHNLLYGGDRVEINNANLYAAIAAKDLRQDMEILRALKILAAPGLDLSKAKGLLYVDPGTTPTINSSFNVKSVTKNSIGNFSVEWGVPFKSIPTIAIVCSDGFVGCDFQSVTSTTSLAFTTRDITAAGTLADAGKAFVLAFGELENE